jgi:hypothetical protein
MWLPGAMSDQYESALRRSSNEGRRQLFGLTHRVIAFICECSREACYETVPLTAAEYDARRPGAIVLPDHADRQRKSPRSGRVAGAAELVGETDLRQEHAAGARLK